MLFSIWFYKQIQKSADLRTAKLEEQVVLLPWCGDSPEVLHILAIYFQNWDPSFENRLRKSVVLLAKVLPLRGDGTSSRRHGTTRFPTSAANVKGVTANVKEVTGLHVSEKPLISL